MSPAADKSKSKKQVMDVEKPGKTPANASSKPVIVGHKPEIQDPMVNNTDEALTDAAMPAAETPTLSPASSKKVIAPLSDDVKAEETDEAAAESNKTPETSKEETKSPETDQAAAAPKTETAKDEPVPKPATSDTKEKQATDPEPVQKAEDDGKPVEASTATEDSASDEAVVDAVADQVGAKKKQEQISPEELKKQEQINKLIAEKKYFVPIGKARHQRNMLWIIVIIVALLGVGTFLVAADAGLVGGVKPPFDFIKTESEAENTVEATTGSDTAATNPPAASQTDQQTTAATPASLAKDDERKADIDAIHAQLEAYFAQNDKYPTLDNFNDASFLAANLKGLDVAALKDPEGTTALLVATPQVRAYSYDVQRSGGGTCDNTTADCMQFTLTATLTDGGAYTKSNLN